MVVFETKDIILELEKTIGSNYDPLSKQLRGFQCKEVWFINIAQIFPRAEMTENPVAGYSFWEAHPKQDRGERCSLSYRVLAG